MKNIIAATLIAFISITSVAAEEAEVVSQVNEEAIADVIEANENASESFLDKHDVRIRFGGFSMHTGANAREMLNQEHMSIGITIDDFTINYIANNSFNNESIYAAYTPTIDMLDWKYAKVYPIIGAATGYNEIETVRVGDYNYYFENEYLIGGLQPLAGVGLEIKASEHIRLHADFLISVTTFSAEYKF